MKYKLLIIAMFISLGVFAQEEVPQEDIDYIELQQSALKSDKTAIIKEALILTNEEKEVFWPLYEEYNQKAMELKKDFLVTMLSALESTEELTDKEAMKTWEKKLKTQEELNKRERKYYNKMLNKLEPKKVVRYFQVENKINSLVNAKIATMIPLVSESVIIEAE